MQRQLGILLLAGGFAFAQAPPQAAFDVATVRPSHGMAEAGRWSPPGVGHFDAASLPLAKLIQLAFDVDPRQIEGKPAWLDTDLFDVAAKPESGIALTREELRPRLQALLQERFHLATHWQTRQVSGFALMVAKGRPKLEPTNGSHWPGFRRNVSEGKLQGFNWSMPFLAQMLLRPAGMPVIDRTGIPGSYDIDLEFAPEGATDARLPSLFAALRETLGLELRPQKVPVQVLVIDHVDRVPTEN